MLKYQVPNWCSYFFFLIGLGTQWIISVWVSSTCNSSRGVWGGGGDVNFSNQSCFQFPKSSFLFSDCSFFFIILSGFMNSIFFFLNFLKTSFIIFEVSSALFNITRLARGELLFFPVWVSAFPLHDPPQGSCDLCYIRRLKSMLKALCACSGVANWQVHGWLIFGRHKSTREQWFSNLSLRFKLSASESSGRLVKTQIVRHYPQIFWCCRQSLIICICKVSEWCWYPDPQATV